MLRAPRTFADMARVGPIRNQAETIDDFITDPKQTAIVAVALAEEMPVNETIDLEGGCATRWGWTWPASS